MNAQYPMWGDKPYNTLNEYCKRNFGEKLYKIALDAGFTCPNRDGTLDTRGCIFCSEGGSGDFAIKTSNSIDEQIAEGLGDVQRAITSSERVFALLDLEEEKKKLSDGKL